MRSRFLEMYNLFMEEIDTKRKPIQKVDQMSPKDFIRFLKEFLPLVKDGKVDLNDVRISEKVDGNAIRLSTINGEMMFESSYSGVTTWDKIPMKDAGKFLYENYSQLFNDIYELIGSDFKIIGELIWISNMEETGKVTPVGASYLTEKFGTHGGIVVFDILKIENNNLVPFEKDKEDEIFNMIRDLNNEDFSFYLTESIDITKNVTFDLDVDSLMKIVNDPEFNKERFNRTKDAKILSELDAIKKNVCAQLSKTIDNTKGAFSEEGDLIEGIVVRINSSGNQYGMFSDGYKDMKHRYWEKYDNIEKAVNEFYKSVFGYPKSQVRRYVLPTMNEHLSEYEEKFNEHQAEYVNIIKDNLNQIKDDETIPTGPKNMQINMGNKSLEKIESPWNEFIKQYTVNN